MTTQSKATLAGFSDAQTSVAENDEATLAQVLRPGQEEADEALINALGTEKTAELFGVAHGSAAWSTACGEYNAAFRAVVAKAVQS